MQGIAAASSALAAAQVKDAVAMHVLKEANEQQKTSLSLLEGAMEVAEIAQAIGRGESVDLYA